MRWSNEKINQKTNMHKAKKSQARVLQKTKGQSAQGVTKASVNHV